MKLENIKSDSVYDIAKTLIKNAEGFSPAVYSDTLGNYTIGYGFKTSDITSMGWVMPYKKLMTEEDADLILEKLLKNIDVSIKGDSNLMLIFVRQYPTVQAVFVDMIYNLGLASFCQFTTFLNYMNNLKYDNAVVDLTNSLWYSQVKSRAIRNCFIILSHSSSLYLI